MEKKNIFVVGGSSGIGLEIVRILSHDGHNVFVGSRKNYQLKGLEGVNHLKLDVTAESLRFDGLPNALDGMVYCPGTIQLRPFQRLSIDDFMADLNVNYLVTFKSCVTGQFARVRPGCLSGP